MVEDANQQNSKKKTSITFALKRLNWLLKLRVWRSTPQLMTLILLTPSLHANADILFEGYSKVLLSGQHVGYAIQKFEFDQKSKEFIATSFLQTNHLAGDITESIKARSDARLHPISYQYTSLAGENTKTIDAQVKKGKITALIRSGKSQESVDKKISDEVFFSAFLGYMMLQGKNGIKTGTRYGYQAIAEEEASLQVGEAYIKEQVTMQGLSVFKVLNTFKGTQYISYVTNKGEVIATQSPVQRIETQLVANAAEATKNLPINTKVLSTLFGTVPAGKENILAREQGTKNSDNSEADQKINKDQRLISPSQNLNPPTKGANIPGGVGIMIKGKTVDSDKKSIPPSNHNQKLTPSQEINVTPETPANEDPQ